MCVKDRGTVSEWDMTKDLEIHRSFQVSGKLWWKSFIRHVLHLNLRKDVAVWLHHRLQGLLCTENLNIPEVCVCVGVSPHGSYLIWEMRHHRWIGTAPCSSIKMTPKQTDWYKGFPWRLHDTVCLCGCRATTVKYSLVLQYSLEETLHPSVSCFKGILQKDIKFNLHAEREEEKNSKLTSKTRTFTQMQSSRCYNKDRVLYLRYDEHDEVKSAVNKNQACVLFFLYHSNMATSSFILYLWMLHRSFSNISLFSQCK